MREVIVNWFVFVMFKLGFVKFSLLKEANKELSDTNDKRVDLLDTALHLHRELVQVEHLLKDSKVQERLLNERLAFTVAQLKGQCELTDKLNELVGALQGELTASESRCKTLTNTLVGKKKNDAKR